MARLAGVEIPVYQDTEKTLGDLKTRIAKTVASLQTFRPEQIDGTEDKEIVIKRGDQETRNTGMQFLLGHASPNVYFHITTAYNILRAQRRGDRQAGLPLQSLIHNLKS